MANKDKRARSLAQKTSASLNDVAPKKYNGTKYTIHNPYTNKLNQYKCQTHCHTNVSSDAVDTPSAMMTAYKNAGYDLVFLTDHNAIPINPNIDGIICVPSCEISYRRHIGAYDISTVTTQGNAQDVFNYYSNLGKMTTLNHPNWDDNYYVLEPEVMGYYNFNFIEIYNGIMDSYAENVWDYALSSGKKVYALCADDCHNIADSEFNSGYILVNADTKTKEDIMANMREGNFYSSNGGDINITVVSNIITATCQTPSTINFIGKNGALLKQETNVTSSSYTILGNEMYVRVKAIKNSNSKCAFSQPIFIDTTHMQDGIIGHLSRFSNLFNIKRQAVYNENFEIWQKGTTFANPTNGMMADGWILGYNTDGGTLPATMNIKQETITTKEFPGSYYCFNVDWSGPGSGYGANAYYHISQKIEHGTRLIAGSGRKLTVTFKAKSSISGKKLGIFINQNYGTGGSPNAQELIKGAHFNLGTHWKRYSYTFTLNQIGEYTTKTFGTDNNDFLEIVFKYIWGATSQGDVYGGSAETFRSEGNVQIAQIKVYQDDKEPDYCPKTYAEELAQCQRYYYQSNDAGASTSVGTVTAIAVSTTQLAIMNGKFPVTMKKIPIISLSSKGVANNVRNTATDAAVSIGTPTFGGVSTKGFTLVTAGTGTPFVAGTVYDFDIVVNAN